MAWYQLIKQYYDRGLYTAEQVRAFVRAGMITAEQYTEITGEAWGA